MFSLRFLNFFLLLYFAVRFLGFVYGTLLLLLTFLFYRKYIKSDMVTALALSFIVPFGVGSWLFGSHHWLVAILQICGGIVFSHSLEHKSRFWAVISGIFFGNAIFTMQDQGGYLVIGLIICTFFVSKKREKIFLHCSLFFNNYLLYSCPSPCFFRFFKRSSLAVGLFPFSSL